VSLTLIQWFNPPLLLHGDPKPSYLFGSYEENSLVGSEIEPEIYRLQLLAITNKLSHPE